MEREEDPKYSRLFLRWHSEKSQNRIIKTLSPLIYFVRSGARKDPVNGNSALLHSQGRTYLEADSPPFHRLGSWSELLWERPPLP